MTLREFLLARITEDYEAVRVEVEVYQEAGLTDEEIDSHSGPGDWGPARVLVECAVKRDVVAHVSAGWPDGAEGWDSRWVLKSLARPYADHPDFKPEWAV